MLICLGDRTSGNDTIVFYFNDSNKESHLPHPHSALYRNLSRMVSSGHQQVAEPPVPREYLQATTSVLPRCVQSHWPRPLIHFRLYLFSPCISFKALVVQPKDNHVENKHRFFDTEHCQLMLGKHRKAHNKLKQALSLQRVGGDLQGGGWVCQQPSFQHWCVRTTLGRRASFLS